MDVREVRVDVEQKVADGQYGNETVRVGFTAVLDEDVSFTAAGQAAVRLAQDARAVVLAHLKESTNEGVRAALETKEEREARWAREQDELRARRQAPSDEPLEGSGELPLKDEDSPF